MGLVYLTKTVVKGMESVMKAKQQKMFKVKYVKNLESLILNIESLIKDLEKEVEHAEAKSDCAICKKISKLKTIINKIK